MWKPLVTVAIALCVLFGAYMLLQRVCQLEREHFQLTQEVQRVTGVLEQEQARTKAIEQSVVQLQASAAQRAAELREYEHDVFSSGNPLVNQCVPDELLRGLRSYRPKDGGVEPNKGSSVPADAAGDAGVHRQ